VTTLDAVTATATRTPQVAGDIAAPASVITREEILRRQPQNLNDLLRDVPGVEADGLPRNSVMQPQIRGLGDDRVVVRLDGARQNFNSGHRGRLFLDPDLLRQVEVLRGPGSMLFGAGALGSVVSFRTVDADDLLRPGEAVTGIVSGGYQGANNQYRGGPTTAFRYGALDGLANVIGRTGENFRDGRGTSIPHSAADTVAGLAKLGWTVGDGVRLGLSVIGFGENTTIPVAANTTDATNIAKRRLRQQQVSLTGRYNPPGSALFDAAATLYYTDVGIDERRVVPGDGRFDTTDYTTFGLDLQNTSRFSLGGRDRHALTCGIDVFRDEQEGTRNGAPRLQFPKADQTILGLFIQDQIGLGAFTLTLGLRYDRYEQSAENRAGRTRDRLSPKASLAWQALPWLAPYLACTEGFRAPSLTELYADGVHFPTSFFPFPRFNFFVPNPDLRPEVARNKEAGVNLRFRDVVFPRDSLRARLSVFQNDIDDFIEIVVTNPPIGNGTTQARNVSTARIRGLEIETGYDSGPWFGSFNASVLEGTNRTQGGPLSLIPAHKAAVTVGHRFLDSGMSSAGGCSRWRRSRASPSLRTQRAATVLSTCSPPGRRLRALSPAGGSTSRSTTCSTTPIAASPGTAAPRRRTSTMSAGTFALRRVRSSDAGSLGACRPVAPREAAPQAGLLASLALPGGAAAPLASLAGSPPPGEQGLGATPVVFVGTAVVDGAADGGTAEIAARADGPEGEDPEGRETAAPESLSDTPPVIEPVPEPPPAAPPLEPVPATALSPVSPVPERNAPSQVAAVAPAGEEMSIERADDRPTEPIHAPTPEAVPARQPARAASPPREPQPARTAPSPRASRQATGGIVMVPRAGSPGPSATGGTPADGEPGSFAASAGPVLVAHPGFRRPPVPPSYPRQAVERGIEGVAMLRVLIGEDGDPVEVRVHGSSGSELLDRAARSAVERWAFRPAQVGGRRVAAWVEVPVRFQLE